MDILFSMRTENYLFSQKDFIIRLYDAGIYGRQSCHTRSKSWETSRNAPGQNGFFSKEVDFSWSVIRCTLHMPVVYILPHCFKINTDNLLKVLSVSM